MAVLVAAPAGAISGWIAGPTAWYADDRRARTWTLVGLAVLAPFVGLALTAILQAITTATYAPEEAIAGGIGIAWFGSVFAIPSIVLTALPAWAWGQLFWKLKRRAAAWPGGLELPRLG
jgi:hypothetical protein